MNGAAHFGHAFVFELDGGGLAGRLHLDVEWIDLRAGENVVSDGVVILEDDFSPGLIVISVIENSLSFWTTGCSPAVRPTTG